jgi:ketosteroid isomerase-like protein
MSSDPAAQSAHEAIRNVLGHYSRAVDDRDFETVGRCFTEDAIASYSGLTIPQGREHVVEHITGISRTIVSQHYLVPIIVEVADDGLSATSLCYGLAVLIQDEDGETRSLGRGLRYADTWRLTDEGWQIANRLHTADWQWELPARVDPGAMWKVKPDTEGETIYRTLRQADAV